MDTPEKPRRDFLFIATGAVAAFGAAAMTRPLLGHMSPAADDIANQWYYFDVEPIAEGQWVRISLRGRPVLIWHRTPAQIQAAQADDQNKDLWQPVTDRSRLQPKPDGSYDPRFLIVYLVCTHFGTTLVPEAGRFDGFYCPAHGANFDLSGRIRSNPAPSNLAIPNYHWHNDTAVTFTHGGYTHGA